MDPLTRQDAAREPRGLRRLLHTQKAQFARAIAFARAWRWGAVVGRIVLAALGLVLLGAIGRSAFARNMLSADTTQHVDAEAAPATSDPPSTSLAVAASATPSANTAAVPEVASPPAAAPATRGRATTDDPVYLNQATLADLHRLPGVGPKRADAILALRAKLGHFRQIEDLLKVKGIGRASLRKLRPLVRLDPPPVVALDAATTPPP
jgi:competence protein ComEA